jgi:exodeoxyribonuclease III
MKIYSWNVNGIRAAKKKGFLEWVQQTQPDILCLQETKAQKEQLEEDLINIEGYYSFFNSAEKKGYSGTAIYSKIQPLREWYGLPQDKFNHEGRTINLEFEDFILMNIYFPNGKQRDERLQFKMDFYEALQDYAQELVTEGKNVIICGDYNTAHHEIDLKNPKANASVSGFLPEERAWMDRFSESGFVDTFRHLHPDEIKYSWWSYMFHARENNAGWRIDYFFVNEAYLSHINEASIHDEVMGSDHCPVSITII